MTACDAVHGVCLDDALDACSYRDLKASVATWLFLEVPISIVADGATGAPRLSFNEETGHLIAMVNHNAPLLRVAASSQDEALRLLVERCLMELRVPDEFNRHVDMQLARRIAAADSVEAREVAARRLRLLSLESDHEGS